MKKLVSLLLVLAFIVALCACGGEENSAASSETPESESVKSEADIGLDEGGSTSDENTDDSVDESVDKSVDESVNEIEDADEEIIDGFDVNGNTIYYTEDGIYTTVWIEHKDGEKVKLYKTASILDVKASPNGKLILYTEYEWEYTSRAFIYDVEKRKSRELDITGLPEEHCGYYYDFIDDENIAFADILSVGTVAIGGDVYCLSLKGGAARKIIATPADWRLQVMWFCKDGDRFVITAGYYDENYAEYERLYFVMPFSEVVDLVKNGGCVTVSPEDATDSTKVT